MDERKLIEEAHRVIDLQNDDQYVGGLPLAEMVLEFFGDDDDGYDERLDSPDAWKRMDAYNGLSPRPSY